MILSAILEILSVIFYCYSAQSFLVATMCETAQPFCKTTKHGTPVGGGLSHFVNGVAKARASGDHLV
jgi:hypothetical protein